MHKHFYLWLILIAVFLWQPACAELPTSVGGQILPSLAPMLEKITDAVVNISASTRSRTLNNPLFNDPFFRRFFNVPERKRSKQSRGTGVIINARAGYVVTNNHVIEKADEISITLLDGRQLAAKLIGTDPETDVALLEVEAKNLITLPSADSDRLRVGDFVVAIGNPFGLGQTVTSGIVSALGRSGLGLEGYEDFIQTDASINPGNSGGALVNLRGELIGINTAIIAPGGGNVGIGFAIPMNMVNQIVKQLVQFGEVRRGILGIQIQNLTPELATAFGLSKRKGAVIVKVEPGSAAEKAKLRTGDIIITINRKTVNSASDVRNSIGLLRVGEKVKITVIRKGRTRNLYAVIAEAGGQIEGKKISIYLQGALLNDNHDGIKVHKVARNSNAEKVGIKLGDIIIGFNRREVKDIEDLTHRFNRYRASSIQVRRDGDILSLHLR